MDIRVDLGVGGDKPMTAVLIRAPAILKTGPDVTVLARILARPSRAALAALCVTSPQPVPTEAAHPPAKRCKPSNAGSINSSSGDAGGAPHPQMEVGKADEMWNVAVAVRQGNIIGTVFHPEYTDDTRWHEYLLSVVAGHRAQRAKSFLAKA